MLKKVLFIALFFPQIAMAQQISWPEITRLNKPWTRWWWPGSIVTQKDLTAAVEKYKAAGLGGMEVTVIYGVKGEEDRFINYLSPDWMKMFTWILKEADRLDLGIDLANASGWPFGGPWVDPADACKNINYKTWFLSGGQKLNEKIEFIQQPLIRAVGQKPDITKLIDPVSKNKDLQLYALDQIRFEKPLPFYSLTAYSDSGKVVILTGNVTPDRALNWTAPPGKWTLYGLFQGWHGKQVERAGPGGEGDVIDHFSGKAVNNYLKHFDDVFKDFDTRTLRGYFNDSYEVDDASGQADWTNDLFYEFYIRRGYNLSANLPALFQKDTPDKNARVLSDYRQTVSDLILEKFTMHWAEWAHRQGKFVRDQAHGSPGNILDLYGASDIPETEGSELTRMKFASSAANVTGKPLVSCEAATWLGEHFTSSLSDVKKCADLFFLTGINHLFYHGTCFSPENEPWPGFLFYASVEFTPANSFWNDFRKLNQYIARVQSFLQAGASDNDILLYFPIFDRYAEYGRGMLEHFDALSPAFDGTNFKAASDLMIQKGYTYDYISDLQITNTDCNDNLLETEGSTYKTLVVPGCKYIPLETFARILRLANDGARIIIYGDLPQNIAGFADKEEKQGVFDLLKSGINFSGTGNPEVSKAVYGNGSILIGTDLDELLKFAGVRRETMTDNNIKFNRRAGKTGYYYFISNQGTASFDGWLQLQEKASSAAIFNPMTEEFGIAQFRPTSDGKLEVKVKLAAGESLIVSALVSQASGKPYLFFDPASDSKTITGNWKVDFVEGGPGLPAQKEISSLISWTDFGGEDVKNFSGTARYSITFKRPAGKADAWLLDLGKVCESADVTLNGNEMGILIGPEYKIIIDKRLLKSVNNVEIKVSNLMANRIAYMDRNNIPWKKFYNINIAAKLKQNTKNGLFDASSWQPRESGLLGPVSMTPMRIAK
ncbi:MAG: glycosyl hydrolase [Bacteroidota bacterium]|nr:glycosyl hydrolase [Bacteroidota bacterium]